MADDDTPPPVNPTPHPLKRLLQGRSLGHPLHPMLVHLPIALWMLSFALDMLALLGARDDGGISAMLRASFYALLAGLAFAVPAMVTGFADYADVRKDHPARRTATRHMLLNLAAVVVFAVSALYRIHQTAPDWLPTAISAVGVLLISYSGYLGGKLVYDDGLAVGRHRRGHEPGETTTVNAPDGGYVDALDAAALPENTPTRVEVNGHVMTLVRTTGGVFAVQEFCTHRCGPLSEGTVEGGNIRCPWHRSCFELRSGKVAEGPAKVELNTYEVGEVDGTIRVRVPNA